MFVHTTEQTEEWAFYSQLGRIFDAFSELEAITVQSTQSQADYLFPCCELKGGSARDVVAMNDTVALLLMPFVSEWMESAGLLHHTYRWDDALLSNFSNRATLAAMARSGTMQDARFKALAA